MVEIKDLLSEIDRLREENCGLKVRNMLLEDENRRLRAELAKKYARASEKSKKASVLNDAELEAANGALNDKDAPKPEKGESLRESARKYTRSKAFNSKVRLPKGTPVVDKYVECEAPACASCGAVKVRDGEIVVETISRRTVYVVVRYHYPVFRCPRCEGDGKSGAASGGNMLAGCAADPMFVAWLANNKYNMGSTLYREERALGDAGIPISRQTLSAWLMRPGERLVANLAPMLEEELLRYPLINADETPTRVLRLDDDSGGPKAPNSKFNAYMLGRTGIDSSGRPGLCVFTFSDNRRNETVAGLFEGYRGAVQSDGLSGYDYACRDGQTTHLGCLVHARRKCIEAMGGRTRGVAAEMFEIYRKIFHAESEWEKRRGSVGEGEFLAGRKAAMLPLMEKLRKLCEDTIALSEETKTPIEDKTRIAISYFLERYGALTAFLDIPYATSSNQLAERTIRKYVIDRNAFLFNITENGAEVTAMYFSLVQSCRNLGINPELYLTHLLLNGGSVKDGDREGWRALLPGRCDLSDAYGHCALVGSARPDPAREKDYVLHGKRLG